MNLHLWLHCLIFTLAVLGVTRLNWNSLLVVVGSLGRRRPVTWVLVGGGVCGGGLHSLQLLLILGCEHSAKYLVCIHRWEEVLCGHVVWWNHRNLVSVEVSINFNCFVYHFATYLAFGHFLALAINSDWTLCLVYGRRRHNFGVVGARNGPFTFWRSNFASSGWINFLSYIHCVLVGRLVLGSWNFIVASFGVLGSLVRNADVSRWLTTDGTDMVVCHNKVTRFLTIVNLSRPKVRLRIFGE